MSIRVYSRKAGIIIWRIASIVIIGREIGVGGMAVEKSRKCGVIQIILAFLDVFGIYCDFRQP